MRPTRVRLVRNTNPQLTKPSVQEREPSQEATPKAALSHEEAIETLPEVDRLIQDPSERLAPRTIVSEWQHPPHTSLEFGPKDLLIFQHVSSGLAIPAFDLPEKYGVQSRAPRGSRYEDEGAAYLLGSGASCIVMQHETGADTSEIIPKGSLVALKKYITSGNKTKDKEIFSNTLAQVILQDIRVLCHPLLRKHENFCKLLYLGWESDTPFPVLVLELAAFGTLQDAIRSEFKLSWLQKCNISMDIAVGLFSLHACGFVHGDIKPSNIMLQRHSERQIVAKILDFSGATEASRFGTAMHQRFVTKAWLAPEVLLGTEDIDWQLADVYAFGLLLTHVFTEFDDELPIIYEIFLEASVPKYFTTKDKEDLLLFFKTCPESDDESVLQLAMRSAKKHSHDPQSHDISILLDLIQKETLSPLPSRRKSMAGIMKMFQGFAEGNGRDFP